MEVGESRFTAKVLTRPRAPEEGVLGAVCVVTAAAKVAPDDVGLIIHGTTLATNAQIERNGVDRRLKLRDLQVFSIVVERGSMAKAAQHLGVSPPAVSEVIADLEHPLGVRLFDRVALGIEPTIYGDAVLKRSVEVFDALKQNIKDIEFLSDATTGEVRVGRMEGPWFAFLSVVILRFSKQYPRIKVHAIDRSLEGIPGTARAKI